MSLLITPKSNISPCVGLKQVSSINFKGDSSANTPNEQEKKSNKLKVGVFFTTLAGVSTALALILKTKGYSLNPSKIFKTPVKKWGIFGAEYKGEEFEKLKVKSIKDFLKKYPVESLVIGTALGSVAGGLVGGKLFDKKDNMKAKYRESIIQLVGNVATPLACVALGGRLFKDKLSPKIIEKFKIKNKTIKMIPEMVASAGFLLVGILLGNKIANKINQNIFNVNDKRKIKLSDMSPHIDDVCLAASLIAPETSISRFIPAALMIAGFSTGIAQEKPLYIPDQSQKCK